MRTFLLTEFSADKTYRQKKAPEQAEAFLFQLAEEVGFEPTKGYKPLPVFKTGAFNRSATLPSSQLTEKRVYYVNSPSIQ